MLLRSYYTPLIYILNNEKSKQFNDSCRSDHKKDFLFSSTDILQVWWQTGTSPEDVLDKRIITIIMIIFLCILISPMKLN